jgi:hypothetical protein
MQAPKVRDFIRFVDRKDDHPAESEESAEVSPFDAADIPF